jgi:hypothetical protein
MIEDKLAQDIWRKPKTGVDENGQPTFGAATQMKGRWLQKNRLIRNAQGEQVTSDVTVTLGPGETIAVGDRLSLDQTVYVDVIALSVPRGLGGAAILKLAYLQSQGVPS